MPRAFVFRPVCLRSTCHPDNHYRWSRVESGTHRTGRDRVANRTLRGIAGDGTLQMERPTIPTWKRSAGRASPQVPVSFRGFNTTQLQTWLRSSIHPAATQSPSCGEWRVTPAQSAAERSFSEELRHLPYTATHYNRQERALTWAQPISTTPRGYLTCPSFDRIVQRPPYMHSGGRSRSRTLDYLQPEDKHGVTSDMSKEE